MNIDPLIDQIAEEAADRLFVNGFGERGTRLVMLAEDRGGKSNSARDLGGWCRDAVRDQIKEAAYAAIRDAMR